jgi:excisionase family DNA binding protein
MTDIIGTPVRETLTIAEVAQILGIGRRTAYEIIQRGEFPMPVQKIGGRFKVSRRILDRYLNGEVFR